jgi:(1->4)-alpha-D-glucan 1-alpha-D-glucosylmutase
LREAKQHSSWTRPNAAYEEGVKAYLRSILGRVRPNPVLTELQAQAEVLAWFGAFNSAAMTTIKYTAPGIPDIYQGNETIDLSLVDPDNRRPVGYALRERLLGEFQEIVGLADRRGALRSLGATPTDGRLKLWLTWRLLQLRTRLEPLYRDGAYVALRAEGERAPHVIAFAREDRQNTQAGPGARAATLAGRFYAQLLESRLEVPAGEAVWGDTRVDSAGWPDGTRLRNELTGETLVVHGGCIELAAAFATLPVAVLVVAD